jgi:hypothetical protein
VWLIKIATRRSELEHEEQDCALVEDGGKQEFLCAYARQRPLNTRAENPRKTWMINAAGRSNARLNLGRKEGLEISLTQRDPDAKVMGGFSFSF